MVIEQGALPIKRHTNLSGKESAGVIDHADSSVTTAKIRDVNVTAGKLATNAVETAKINGSAVTSAKLATDSVINAKILNDTILPPKLKNSGFWPLTNYTGASSDNIISFSSAVHQTEDYKSSDGGLTWGANAVTGDIIVRERGGFKNNAIAIVSASGACDFTTDATNWGSASAEMANVTNVKDACYFTGNKAVAVGQAGAGVNIWITTDGGDNWTQATSGPSGAGADDKIWSVDMFNATVGVAIAEDGSYWVTSNAGVDWTDSNQNYGDTNGSFTYVCMTSATTFVTINAGSVKGGSGTLAGEIYYNADLSSAGTIRIEVPAGESATHAICTNLWRTNSGDIFFAKMVVSTPEPKRVDLYMSNDNGISWKFKPIGSPVSYDATLHCAPYQTSLMEYNDGSLIIALGGGHFIKWIYTA